MPWQSLALCASDRIPAHTHWLRVEPQANHGVSAPSNLKGRASKSGPMARGSNHIVLGGHLRTKYRSCPHLTPSLIRRCSCGEDFGGPRFPRLPEGKCFIACAGDVTQRCGAFGVYSIYR